MLYDREIVEKVIAELSTPDILVLLGSRQVGKTTILEIIRTRLRDRNKKIRYQAENTFLELH